MVKRLRRNRADVHTHVRIEHLQVWLRVAYPYKTSTPPPIYKKPVQDIMKLYHF